MLFRSESARAQITDPSLDSDHKKRLLEIELQARQLELDKRRQEVQLELEFKKKEIELKLKHAAEMADKKLKKSNEEHRHESA